MPSIIQQIFRVSMSESEVFHVSVAESVQYNVAVTVVGGVSGGGGAVDSVFGRDGDVVAALGDYNTGLVTEGSNLYFTEARANAASDVVANTSVRHAHLNQDELDLITDGNHDVRTDNPHTVTKSQVGLSDVDNTSDADKPLSDAAVTALAGKSDTGHGHTASDVSDFDTEVGNHADVSANTTARHSHTNKLILDTILDGGSGSIITLLERLKLSGIEEGAEANVVDSVHGRVGDVVGTNKDYTGVEDWEAEGLHLAPTTGTGLTAGIINFSSLPNTWLRFNPDLSDFEFTNGVRYHNDIMMNAAQENAASYLRFSFSDDPYLKWDTLSKEFELSHPFLVSTLKASGSEITITDKVVFEGDIRGEDFYVNHLGASETAKIYFGSTSDPQNASLNYSADDDYFSTDRGFAANWLRADGSLFINAAGTVGSSPYVRFTCDVGGGDIEQHLTYSATNLRFEFDDSLHIDSHLTLDGVISCGTINEQITDAGVTVEGTNFNDGGIQFDLAPTIAHGEGTLHWDDDSGTLELGMPGGVVMLPIGQGLLYRVTNKTGSTILAGKAVYTNGSQGGRATIAMSSADATTGLGVVIGFTMEDIADNVSGYITTVGVLKNLDTSAFIEGMPLWLSTTAGEITQTPPSAPDHRVVIGGVITSHATEGKIYIQGVSAKSLSSLSDVNGTTPDTTNKHLVWDDVNKYWDADQISHNDLADVDANAHIDWTDAAEDLLTTGSVECDEVILTDGIEMTKVFTSGQMHNNRTWTGTPYWDNDYTTGAAVYNTIVMGNPSAEAFVVQFQVPENWVAGTEISVDLGFGLNASSPQAGNVDLQFIPVAHTYNLSGGGDEGHYIGREYSSSRSATINVVDVAAYSQTFVIKKDIVLTADGSLGSGNIAPGDMLLIQFRISDGTTDPVTSSQAHAALLNVHYKVSDHTVDL